MDRSGIARCAYGYRLPPLWSQERYRAITSAYYRGAVGALIVYDITKACNRTYSRACNHMYSRA